MASNDIYINDKYLNYLNDNRRLQIFFGGSSSGKSFFLSQRIVIRNLQGTNFLIVRQTANTIRRSCFNEILKTMQEMNVLKQYSVNGTDMVITNNVNGKQILFCGLSDPEKLKSISPRNGVLEEVFIEEATECTYEGYKQLQKRLRGLSDRPKIITMAFNPILKTHWIYKEFFQNCWDESKSIYEDENKLIVKSTYKDNKFLTKEDVDLLESETDPYYYQVYVLGNFGILGSVIFKNWRTENLSEFKRHADNIYVGVDFGFVDPTAAIKVHVDNDRKKIYVLDEIYRRGISIPEFSNDLKRIISRNQYVYCDSAEPRSINELNTLGIKAIPVRKGPDSILYGIKFLQKYEIIVDISCQNLINELSMYHWQERQGEVLEIPVDKNNHAIDSLRYSVNALIENSRAFAGNRIY